MGLYAINAKHLNGEDMITKELFGKMPRGEEIYVYTVANKNGAYFKVLNLGGILKELWMPDRDGKLSDVVCGFDNIDGYLEDDGYYGAVIGRFANRIRCGRFTLNGMTYQLALNENGVNHIHGGNNGFNKKLWNVVPYEKVGQRGVILTCISEDGDENYPGALIVKVVYSITDNNELKIEYTASTDKDTLVNLTNHSYFNLDGAGSGTVLDHYLTLNSDGICETDEKKVPTGNILSVSGTAFDFREKCKLGDRISSVESPISDGYDHCYFLNDYDGSVKLQAELYSERSGRVMSVYTDKPCIQLSTVNTMGKTEEKHPFNGAVCLATQHAPDSPNHDEFPSTKLRVGEKYKTTTVYAFSVK